MRIGVEISASPIREPLLEALANSCKRLGHEVSGSSSAFGDPGAVLIVWNGRGIEHPRERLICCENGWLPRSSYQVQVGGINGAGHLARRAEREGLPHVSKAEAEWLDEYLTTYRNGGMRTYEYNSTGGVPWKGLGRQKFILAPLQMPGDLNMEMAPEELRDNQGFIDAVSRSAPPWPVVFKQHPADRNQGNPQLRLLTRRPEDVILPHRQANVGRVLKSSCCIGVVTINSNVANEALVWGKPVIALGDGIWPTYRGVVEWSLPPVTEFFLPENEEMWRLWYREMWTPFYRSGPNGDWVEPYLHWLIVNQWDVSRANNLAEVEQLLEETEND